MTTQEMPLENTTLIAVYIEGKSLSEIFDSALAFDLDTCKSVELQQNPYSSKDEPIHCLHLIRDVLTSVLNEYKEMVRKLDLFNGSGIEVYEVNTDGTTSVETPWLQIL